MWQKVVVSEPSQGLSGGSKNQLLAETGGKGFLERRPVSVLSSGDPARLTSLGDGSRSIRCLTRSP